MMGARPNASVLVVVGGRRTGAQVQGVDGKSLKPPGWRALPTTSRWRFWRWTRRARSRTARRTPPSSSCVRKRYAHVQKNGIRLTRRLELPPGTLPACGSAPAKATAAPIGSVMYDLDVPDFSKADLSMGGLLLTSASSSRMPTANPDRDFKEILPGSPTAMREFPSGDELAIAVDVYDNKVATPHRVEIRTTVTADDGNVVFNSTDERKSEELKGVNGTYGHVATIPLKGVAPGRYVLRVEAQVAPLQERERLARGGVHRTLMHEVETLARGEDSRLVEPRRFLIRDRQSFGAVWAAHAGPAATVPARRLRHTHGRGRLRRRATHGRVLDHGDRHTPRAPGRWQLRARGARRRAGARSRARRRADHRLSFPHRDAAARRRENPVQPARSRRSADDDLQGSAKGPRDAGVSANCCVGKD